MTIQAARQAMQPLNASMEALAALGAALNLAAGNETAEGVIADRIQNVIASLDDGLLDGVSKDDADILYAMIRSFFRQALDLIENPGRGAVWSFDDPVILQAQGKASRGLVEIIAKHVSETPALSERFDRPGKFLDIGSGTGWISMEVASCWPALQVDGFDIFQPALTLAAENLASSHVVDRVTFHDADFVKLDAVEAYCAAFLAAPFMPRAVIDEGLPSLHRALEPGGWIFFAIFKAAPDALSQALLDLRVARSGGHGWTPESVAQLLADNGFQNTVEIEFATPAMLIAGQKL